MLLRNVLNLVRAIHKRSKLSRCKTETLSDWLLAKSPQKSIRMQISVPYMEGYI
jgi:hypothetical protein